MNDLNIKNMNYAVSDLSDFKKITKQKNTNFKFDRSCKLKLKGNQTFTKDNYHNLKYFYKKNLIKKN